MSLKFTCPECLSNFRYREEHAGKAAKCPKCQMPIRLPALVIPPQKAMADDTARRPPALPPKPAMIEAEVISRTKDKRTFVRRNWLLITVLVLPLFCCCGWFFAGTTSESWTNDNGTEYLDTYTVFGRKHIHRKLWMYDDDNKLIFSSSGPMSETGKPHGKWEMLHFDLNKLEYEYYWYGEVVSEGEWHLRNK